MIRNLLLFHFIFLTITVVAQTVPSTQPFGQIDKADLEMKVCDFEKDANAMVLFNKCTYRLNDSHQLKIEHHQRIKIFNLNSASSLGSISYDVKNDDIIRSVNDLKAETINLENGNIVFSKIDKEAIFKQKIDNWTTRYTFSFSSLRAGSVLECSYTETFTYITALPDWQFQASMPVRYSECKLVLPKGYTYYHQLHTNYPLVSNTDEVVAMSNIPSQKEEPYMVSQKDNLQFVSFVITSFDGTGNKFNQSTTWQQLAAEIVADPGYLGHLTYRLPDEEKIIDSVKGLKPEDKIAFIFNKVKNRMRRKDDFKWIPTPWLTEAWDKQSGNASAINMIVCRLLSRAGLDANPIIISTQAENRIYPDYPSVKFLNRTLTHVRLDSTRYYVMDASSRKNKWNEMPMEVLDKYAVYINYKQPAAGLIFIENPNPIREIVYVNGEILPEGKVKGKAEINSYSYNKTIKGVLYDLIGEKKYNELIEGDDHNLKTDSVSIQNLKVDSLPLQQKFNFTLNLTSSDDKYIYFNPNLFTLNQRNPFINSTRNSDIDFIFHKHLSITGIYKIPKGFNIESLPVSLNLLMPDRTISFKRITTIENETIMLHYIIEFKKSYFFKEDYEPLYKFYKKLYEMLNEQIVLKKA